MSGSEQPPLPSLARTVINTGCLKNTTGYVPVSETVVFEMIACAQPRYVDTCLR